MNFIRQAYCRSFQFCFKIAMPLLPYTNPKILDSVEQVPEEFASRGIKNVLLVTDSFLRPMCAGLEKALSDKGINAAVYDKTCPNPTITNVEQALELYKANKCQALIGFGGGSSIDCAKAVGARVAYPKKSIIKMKGVMKITRKIPLLAAIPTTAGTGSEVTVTAVITDDKTHYKYTINSFPLIPKIAVLDPKVTYSLPKQLTATTGMDALTHAVEAYIGRSTIHQTRKWAKTAIKLIFENIEIAYNNPENEEARRNMLMASHLAGAAFSKSYVGYVHAVAHSLGGTYNIPHGLANSVLLPYVLDAYGKSIYKKLKRLAVLTKMVPDYKKPQAAAITFISAIRALNARMEIPETLKGIKEEDIPVLAKRADKEANPLYPVPKLMNAKELEKFYRMVMEK